MSVVILTLLATSSLCYLHKLEYTEVQKIVFNETSFIGNRKVSLNIDNTLIACVNVSNTTLFYRLNQATGLYQDNTNYNKTNLSIVTLDFGFSRTKQLYYEVILTADLLKQVVLPTLGKQFKILSNDYDFLASFGNNGQNLTLCCSVYYQKRTYSRCIFFFWQDFNGSYFYQSKSQNRNRVILFGKSQNGIFLKQGHRTQIIRFSRPYLGYYLHQQLSFASENNRYWLASDISYDERFIVASLYLSSFFVWMLASDGYYIWLQTEDLTNSIINTTINNLRFSKDGLMLFISFSQQMRVYTKQDPMDFREQFKLNFKQKLPNNSYSEFSSDGTKILSINNQTIKIFNLTTNSIQSQLSLLIIIPFSVCTILFVILCALIIYFPIKHY